MIFATTAGMLALCSGGCSNGSQDGDGKPPFLAKDELQGKIFKKGETAYYAFEEGEVSYIDCTMNGRASFEIAGRLRNIEVTPEETDLDFVVVASKRPGSPGFAYRALFAPKEVTGFRTDNSLTDKGDQIVAASDKEGGELSWEDVKTIPPSTITGFVLLKDGARVSDRAQLDAMLSGGPTPEDGVEMGLFIRPPLRPFQE